MTLVTKAWYFVIRTIWMEDVCAMENVDHNGTFLAVFGGTYYKSRLKQACMQVDREMGLRPDQ